MAELSYWLWLSSAGLSPRAKAALLERFEDAEAVFRAPAGALDLLPGLTRAEAALLERRDLSLAEDVREACERQGLKILTLQDAGYPALLRHIFSPPVVLYVQGELSALEQRVPIAVIGTRDHSDYGLRMGNRIAGGLARCGAALVSPLSSRIEQETCQSALHAGGAVIGVLAVPHERETRPLAAQIAAQGALVSEYPPYTRPIRSFFRDRNRIASGLSLGVLVVEAPEKSGTRLFADEAAEQGKEIFAVPGNADSRSSAGTLRMIREGAKLVTSGWDLLSEFEALYPERVHRAEDPIPDPLPEPEHTPEEKKSVDKPDGKAYSDLKDQLAGLSEPQLRIVTALAGTTLHIDDIIETTGLPTATVLSQLTVLEIRGYVKHEPGRRFTLKTIKK